MALDLSKQPHIPSAIEQLFIDLHTELRSHSRFSVCASLEHRTKGYLTDFLSKGEYLVDKKKQLFRARINGPTQTTPYEIENMMAPPKDKAKAGRLNPEGIPFLYLAESPETAIAEVRPWPGALVSVAEVRPKRLMRCIDFSSRSSLSDEGAVFGDIEKIYQEALFSDRHFGAQIHRDDELSYLPTQYIAHLIRSMHLDGIRFRSMVGNGGMNCVFFDVGSCEPVDGSVKLYGVKKASLETELVESGQVNTGFGKYLVVGKDW